MDLDNAVLQTGETLHANAENEAVQQAMTTFSAIPTTTKRRVGDYITGARWVKVVANIVHEICSSSRVSSSRKRWSRVKERR